MKICPNCHNQAGEDALSCPVCGTTLDTFCQPDVQYFKQENEIKQTPTVIPSVPVRDPRDHTGNFDPDDIAVNKLICIIVYLLDFAGVIIALLMAPNSNYTRFHIRQSLKFTVLEVLILLAALLLCWTFLIPIVGLICLVILIVLKFLCFINVCQGKAKDAPIISSIKFLS